LLQPFSFRNQPELFEVDWSNRMKEDDRQCMLAVKTLATIDSDDPDTHRLLTSLKDIQLFPRWRNKEHRIKMAAALASMSNSSLEELQHLSAFLSMTSLNIVDEESGLWIDLIDALAPYGGNHAEGILCSLASYHSLPEVRAAAVRSFSLAPAWALNHIQGLRRIAYAIDADPDKSVRDAAAASFQELKARAIQQQPELLEEVRPVLPGCGSPPAPKRNAEGAAATVEQQQDLQESIEEDLSGEQEALHEAILRSKADAWSWSADGTVLCRLTFHSPDVMACLLESRDLASCRERVESSGCSVKPDWANGALLLVPVTEQQIKEADIELSSHSILMLASDEQRVKEALASLARRKRPALKPEHYPHGKSKNVLIDSKGYGAQTKQQDVSQDCPSPGSKMQPLPGTSTPPQTETHRVGPRPHEIGIVVERTFLSFPVKKDVSEASAVVQSAPAEGSIYSERVNPHQWRLPRQSDEEEEISQV
jgi:hypothetical protein